MNHSIELKAKELVKNLIEGGDHGSLAREINQFSQSVPERIFDDEEALAETIADFYGKREGYKFALAELSKRNNQVGRVCRKLYQDE